MKKNLRYLEWIPFAVCFGAFIIYIVYTINIKLNPAIIVTDKLINTLKTYLIIALVSLFIGLLIILIKKIYKLVKSDENIVYTETKTIKVEKPVYTEERIVVNTTPVKAEEIKEEKITIKQEPIQEERIIVDNTPIHTEEKIIVDSTPVQTKEEKIIIKQEPIQEERIVVNPTVEKVVYKQEKSYDDVICHECGKVLSKNAAICPNCGIVFDDAVIRIIKKYDKNRSRINPFRKIVNLVLILVFIILIIIVSNMLYNKYKDNIKNVTDTIVRRR